MKITNTYWILILSLTGMLFYSCQKDVTPVETGELTQQEPLSYQEQLAFDLGKGIKLGKKLENPYSVKNMRNAYTSLMEKHKKSGTTYHGKTLKDTTEITITDYYVNSSDYEVTIEMIILKDSIVVKSFNIPPGEEREGLYEGFKFSGGDEPASEYLYKINRFDPIFLSVNDTVVREWGRLKENEMNINSPFNPDSWVVELYDSIIEGVHGRMTFTMTNADITK